MGVAMTALVKLGAADAGLVQLTARSAMMRAIAQWAARRTDRGPAAVYRYADLDRGRSPGSGLATLVRRCGELPDINIRDLGTATTQPTRRTRAGSVVEGGQGSRYGLVAYPGGAGRLPSRMYAVLSVMSK